MKDEKDSIEDLLQQFKADSLRGRFNPASIFSVAKEVKCLDTAQLEALENSFRITSYNVCYTKLLRARCICFRRPDD